MKSLLLSLTGLVSSTLASNGSVLSTIKLHTIATNEYLKSSINEAPASLFNNEYNYLSNNDWITNQSVIDHKFYSYDTSSLKNYIFTNARNVFLVDTLGNLVYNPKVSIPLSERFNIDNTKQEMISHRKVSSVKDETNYFSKSEYSTSYFVGANSSWTYLQQGSMVKHIDISSQSGAIKVENNKNLSESLSLYYIGKAIRSVGGIDETIANNLAQL